MAQAALRKPSVQNNPLAKRKRPGEQVAGGLIIVRSTEPPRLPASQPTQSSSSRPTPPPTIPASQPEPSTSTQPPSRAAPPPTPPPPTKKRRASPALEPRLNGSRTHGRDAGHDRDVQMDEQIAQLEEETRSLRHASRASSASAVSNPEFLVHEHGSPMAQATRDKNLAARKGKPPRGRGGSTAVEDVERRGRDPDAKAGPSNHRRKSSLSARGKRASNTYETSGIITHPHPSVPISSFYKHIDEAQPDAVRLSQLLIWCSARAATAEPDPPDKKTPLPPISDVGKKILAKVQHGIGRALAERQIDTATYSNTRQQPTPSKRESHFDVANREKEALYQAQVERAKAEDVAWTSVGAYYNAHQTNVIQALETRARDKGKARADVNTSDLSSRFLGSNGLDLAKAVMQEHAVLLEQVADPEKERSELEDRLSSLPFKVNLLHEQIHTQATMVASCSQDLTARFAELSLATRSQPPITPIPALPHPPFTGPTPTEQDPQPDPPALAPPALNPRTCLRALARHEFAQAVHNPDAVPPQVRTASRNIQRAVDAGAILAAPATPRRTAGAHTQHLNTTPGPSRRLPGTPGHGR